MSDVKAKLAAATCDAAPYGWSDRTKGKFLIDDFRADGAGGFVGFVRLPNGQQSAINWHGDGLEKGDDSTVIWNLVPLPAPEPVNKKTTGLYRKYNVSRVDGTDCPGGKHENCRLFVLDADCDPHARVALRAYSESCRSEYPALAADVATLANYNLVGSLRCDAVFPSLAPEPERLTDDQIQRYASLSLYESERSMARELIKARRTIADNRTKIVEQAGQIEELRRDLAAETKAADDHKHNENVLEKMIVEQAEEIERLREEAAVADHGRDAARDREEEALAEVERLKQYETSWRAVTNCLDIVANGLRRIGGTQMDQVVASVEKMAAEIERLTQDYADCLNAIDILKDDRDAKSKIIEQQYETLRDEIAIRQKAEAEIERLKCRLEVAHEAEIDRMVERDAAIELARKMGDQLVANMWAIPKGLDWTAFNQRYGDKPAPAPTCDHEWRDSVPYGATICTRCGMEIVPAACETAAERQAVGPMDTMLPTCDHEWLKADGYCGATYHSVCKQCGAIGEPCNKCGGVCLEGCGCDDAGLVVVPTCKPLPPGLDEPKIEFVRYQFDPARTYRPKTIERNNLGRVVRVDCGPIVLTGEFQGLVDGLWRAI